MTARRKRRKTDPMRRREVIENGDEDWKSTINTTSFKSRACNCKVNCDTHLPLWLDRCFPISLYVMFALIFCQSSSTARYISSSLQLWENIVTIFTAKEVAGFSLATRVTHFFLQRNPSCTIVYSIVKAGRWE